LRRHSRELVPRRHGPPEGAVTREEIVSEQLKLASELARHGRAIDAAEARRQACEAELRALEFKMEILEMEEQT
jgi:hypothetical protein